MNEHELAVLIMEALCTSYEEEYDDYAPEVESFRQRGIITNNEGLVVSFSTGDEFQVTIVQSEFGTDEGEES